MALCLLTLLLLLWTLWVSHLRSLDDDEPIQVWYPEAGG